MKQRVIAILGPDHGGSTMVGAMLASSQNWNTHPHLGEFHALFSEKPIASARNCAAGHKPCLKWESFDKQDARYHQQFIEMHQCDSVIDSSKYISWFSAVPRDVKMTYIYVWRDPVKIRESYKKRFSIIEAEAKYSKQFLRLKDDLNWIERKHKNKKIISLSLESLLNDPANNLKKLCEAVDIEYFSGKEEFWKFEHHHLAGATSVRQAILHPETATIVHAKQEEKSDLKIEIERMLSERAWLTI
jgi:hypothetical protein